MRIVHVCRQYAPAIGGIEEVVEQLARHQRREGHQVKVVTLNRLFGTPSIIVPTRSHDEGIEIARLSFAGSERYPLVRGVLREVRGHDLVHVHGVDFFFDFLAWTKPFHRRMMIATTHGGFFHTTHAAGIKRYWFQTVTRLSARAYALLIACSPADYALFEALRHPGLRLIENGVDTSRFAGAAAAERKAIIYFGRLAPNKGLDRLLGWFAAVHARDPEWRLIIAGRPSGIAADDVRDEADRLGVGEWVRVIDSPSVRTLRRLIEGCSVFASASSYEGFGLAAVEAAAAGLMPVLSDIPPFERTLQRLGAGIVSSFEPTAAEADRFLDAWARWRPSHRAVITEAASQQFGWVRPAAAYAALCDRLFPRRRRISGIDVWAPSRPEALSKLADWISMRRPLLVTFCNAHSVNTARRDPAMRRALGSAVVLNDGVGLDLASNWLFGSAFPDNLNGTDFTPALLAHVERPLRLYLLGSAPGVGERAARALASRFPQHDVVGVQHGFFAEAESERIVADIRAASPDLILVGMGQPRQEVWAHRHLATVPAVTMCVGAYLDFAAGVVARAPQMIRRMRLEWAYRLWQEPRRLASRYLIGNAAFLYAIARERFEQPQRPWLAQVDSDTSFHPVPAASPIESFAPMRG